VCFTIRIWGPVDQTAKSTWAPRASGPGLRALGGRGVNSQLEVSNWRIYGYMANELSMAK
jgi:hypothetical protein